MAEAETGEVASRWKRLTGALVDGLIASVLTLPVMLASGIFQTIQQGEQPGVKYQAFFFLYGLVIFLLLNGWLLAKRGQTVGKLVVGTRIVSNETGEILPFPMVFGLRYFPVSVIAQVPIVGNVFCFVDALFIFRKERRCVHDILAGTKVVNV